MPNESASKKLILLLISDPLSLSVVQEALESAGYVVLPAGDFGTAVDRLDKCEPDLLIVRSYISSMPGHEAAKYLKGKCPRMRVLILGGLLDDDRLKHRYEIARFEVFPKPYPAAQLLEKVKEILHTTLNPRSNQWIDS